MAFLRTSGGLWQLLVFLPSEVEVAPPSVSDPRLIRCISRDGGDTPAIESRARGINLPLLSDWNWKWLPPSTKSRPMV
jgi:hypothetical protein